MSPKIKHHNYLYNIYNKIQPGSVIALDNHPVSYYILDFLNSKNVNVSIVTYSTDIMKYLCKNTTFNIIFTTGQINSALHTITGKEVADKIKQLQIDYYFCEARYMDHESFLFQIHEDIAHIQTSLINQANVSYLINYPDICNSDVKQNLSLIGQLV